MMGMNAERPSMAKEADLMSRKEGVRKRGCMVKMPQPKALIVAYQMSIPLRV